MATLQAADLNGIIGESIDRLINTELETRPGPSRGKIAVLYDAARQKTGKPLTLAAAEALVRHVKEGATVIVSTGWVIDFWFPKGEICGMTGAVSVTRALVNGLGAKVCFLTEEPVVSVYEAVCRAAGVRIFPEGSLARVPRAVIAKTFPVAEDAARNAATEYLDALQPAAVITLEKCARNQKGVYHTGQGNDMSPTTAKVDLLVEEARRRGILTIGIGDLGNEIGFGKIRETVETVIPYGARCKCPCGGGMASAVETDYLIVAAASNRGGYGLEACLAAVLDMPELMHDGVLEQNMIRAVAGAGAIDSFTVGPTTTDGHGVPMQISSYLVELLRHLARYKTVKFPMFAVRA